MANDPLVSIKFDGLAEVQQRMKISEKQTRFALSRTLNIVVKPVMEDQRKEMRDVFDRPTPWTLNSQRQYGKATKDKLETTVDFKANFNKGGIDPDKYLTPEIQGGRRRLKRYEVALRSVGALPDDMFTVPGEAARLDAYGNISAGQVVQLLAFFKAFPEAGYKSNMSEKDRARLAKDKKRSGQRGYTYFAGRVGDGRGPEGIWQRFQTAFGTAVKPVLIFVKTATYEPVYDIDYTANRTMERELQPTFDAEFERAMASAK